MRHTLIVQKRTRKAISMASLTLQPYALESLQ